MVDTIRSAHLNLPDQFLWPHTHGRSVDLLLLNADQGEALVTDLVHPG